MKYLKFIILAISLSTLFTGCSYLSDMAEGELTTRSSFSAEATYSGGTVTITWDETDSSEDFAGIEIYRTNKPNREFADYELVASQYKDYPAIPANSGRSLSNGLNTTYTVPDDVPYSVLSGETYFYRVAFIHWDNSDDDVVYVGESDYYSYTHIDEISGYAKVIIP